MEAVIKTRQITKRFGSFAALNDVNITVNPGDIYGLIGDNGAGKSTLFKLLSGLQFATKGEIQILGASTQKDLEKVRSRTGVIVEQPGFYPNLSVAGNLEYYRLQKGVPGKDTINKVLDLVNLAYAKNKKAKSLSMGMKQRLGLAIALLGEPEVLILDEPISGLDPSGIIEMRNLMLKLNKERSITIVLSSHNLPELEQLATVYAFLNRGQLLEEVSVDTLKERCSNFIDIKISNVESYAVLLERQLQQSRYQVLPENTIRVIDPSRPIEYFSKVAAEHGMDIYSLSRHQMSLEQYYINLKERSNANA